MSCNGFNDLGRNSTPNKEASLFRCASTSQTYLPQISKTPYQNLSMQRLRVPGLNILSLTSLPSPCDPASCESCASNTSIQHSLLKVQSSALVWIILYTTNTIHSFLLHTADSCLCGLFHYSLALECAYLEESESVSLTIFENGTFHNQTEIQTWTKWGLIATALPYWKNAQLHLFHPILHLTESDSNSINAWRFVSPNEMAEFGVIPIFQNVMICPLYNQYACCLTVEAKWQTPLQTVCFLGECSWSPLMATVCMLI